MAFFRWILAIPIIVLVILFAFAHPETTSITWSPFHEPKMMPLYFVVIMFLGIGILLGALIAWIGMFPTWREKRQLQKDVRQLEKDLNTANEKLIEELSKEKADPYTRLPASALSDKDE